MSLDFASRLHTLRKHLRHSPRSYIGPRSQNPFSDQQVMSGKKSPKPGDPPQGSDVEKADVVHVEAVPVQSVSQSDEEPGRSFGEDPLSEFSRKEIARTWLKVDLHILPVAVLLYFSSYIARTNTANAKVLGMGTDLNLTANEYNLALSIFFVGYVSFETPSNIIIRRINPRVYIAAMALIWGLICSLISIVKNSSGLIAGRLFLGLAEAGFLPGIILWMGSWYPRPMQGRRFSVLYCTVSLTGAFGGLLATGINTLDGKRGIAGWRWIFIIEGAISIILGVYTFVFFSPSPTTASWLKPREKRIILLSNEIDRALRADEPFSAKQIKTAFTDWRTYLWGLMYWMCNVPVYSVLLSLPVVVTGLGHTGTNATLFAVWPYFAGFGYVAVGGWTLDRYGHKFVHYCVAIVIASIALVVLALVENLLVCYVMYFFVMFMFPPVVTMWSWLAQNVAGSNKRAAATGFVLSMANVGGIVGGQIYRAEWAPRYVQGHVINIACYAVALVAGTAMWLSYKRDNVARDRAEGFESGAVDTRKKREGMLGMDLGDLGDRDPRYRYYL